ncbi:F-box associated domain, type, partial [Trema orientale]
LDKLEQLPLMAEVYSLKGDSWRDIGIHMQFDGLPFADAVFCQGVLYWCIWDPQKYMIFSFDMYDEVFHRIACPDTYDEVRMPFPDNLIVTPGKENRLVVWNDSVALLYYPYLRGAPFLLEVWVLNDCFGGVKGSCSWIKNLTIGPLDGIVTAWTFWKNDELLLGATGGRLVSYNLRSQMLRNHTIQGARIPRRWEFSCVKSLVSVQGGN